MKLELRRQFVHMLAILFIFVFQFLGKWNTAILLFIGVILFIIIGKIRTTKKIKIVQKFETNIIKKYERENEFPFKGAITLLLGIIFAILLFQENIAVACIVVLSISDSLSTIIGKIYGKHIILNSTIEGSIGFLISAFIILLFFTNPLKAFFVAIIGAIIELIPFVDDNLIIPLVIGVLLTL
ncbi:MAG: hypothetical protein J7K26_01345 [Candidatus Aenigmarchaeota archaeon]|nr:hypothetical protein [Candidatus Aenigmarchaeota archaeon]